jgi:hypothetical protein
VSFFAAHALWLKEQFYQIKANILMKKLSTQEVKFQIFHPHKGHQYNRTILREFYHFIERVGTENQEGMNILDENEWEYWRERPFIKGLFPSYVAVRLKNKLIGIAYFTRQWIYASSFGIHFPMANLREFLVDHKCGVSTELLNDIYTGLGFQIVQAAKERDCPLMTIGLTPNHHIQGRGLKTAGFFSVSFGIYMLRPMKSDLPLPAKTRKPIVVNPCDSLLYP